MQTSHDKSQMMETYDALYSAAESQRFRNEGLMGLRYRLPKYLSYLNEFYGRLGPLSILEVGAGNGEMFDLIRAKMPEMIRDYTAVEYSATGAECLKKKDGLKAAFQMDACKLELEDDGYDLVLCFDVMHHVHDPAAMAREMLRVTRRHFFLCEANGLSVLRKINELRAGMKAFGEQSYTPRKYASFFPKDKLNFIKTWPFYNFVVPKLPEKLISANIALSEFLEKIPGIRWQGLSVVIHGEKKAGASTSV